MAEIDYEKSWGALESTRRTAVTPPTHDFNAPLLITPRKARRRGVGQGSLVPNRKSVTARKDSTWDLPSHELDIYNLLFWASMAIDGSPAIATPAGGTNARTFTFSRDVSSDSLKSATLYGNDPNVKMFQIAGAMADELAVEMTTGEDGGSITQAANGRGLFPTSLGSAPTAPTATNAPMLIPGLSQLWIDSSSAIGTTEIADARLVGASFTIPTGVTYKYNAQGPSSTLGYAATGRTKQPATLDLSVEFFDTDEYDLWNSDTQLKTRLRLNGPIIEGSLRHYVQLDIYGPFNEDFDWADLEGSNRLLDLSIDSEDNSTAGYDYVLVIQTDKTSV